MTSGTSKQPAPWTLVPLPTAMLLLCLAVSTGIGATETPSLDRAHSAINQSDYEQAMRLLSEWLGSHPDHEEARYLYAQSLGRAQRFDEAATEYERLLQVSPDNVDYMLGQAQTMVWTGHPEKAAPVLRRARRLAPSYEDVWRLEIQALLAIGDESARQKAKDLSQLARKSFPEATWIPGETDIERAAVQDPAKRWQLASRVTYDALDSGLPDWHAFVIEADYHLDERTVVFGHIRQTDRFDTTDNELTVGAYIPMSRHWTAVLEGSVGPDAVVLPVWVVMGRLELQLVKGWSLGSSHRHSEYDSTYVDVWTISVDRYWSSYRFSYALHGGEPEDADITLSHVVRLDRYYGADSQLGILYATGEESESVGLDSLLVTDTESVAVMGRHWLSAQWALLWSLSYHEQGDIYTRTGIDVGIKRRF